MKKILLSFLLIVTCLFSSVFCLGNNFTFAETKEYSNVIDDLQKDKNFNKENYPINNEDYALQVIQIAESAEQELFIYVYQPCTDKKLTVTSINISTTIGENLSFYNYLLTYINSEDTLFKYKVNGLKISTEEKRYYEISSIFRAWNKDIDKPADKITNNTIDEISYKVGKAYTFNGNDLICQDIETIEVASKYIGFVRYRDGFILERDSCDSHFVAFSTDKKIDKLIQVEMSFVAEYIDEVFPSKNNTTKLNLVLSEEDNFSYMPLWNKNILRNRIVTVSEFLSDENLKEEYIQNLVDKEWVLRFYESSYSYANSMYFPQNNYTRVSEVTLLRFKFETEGVTYNLGVVDNKQTGSNTQINKNNAWWQKVIDFFASLPKYLKILIYILLGLVVVIVVSYVIKLFIKIVEFFVK